MQASKGKTLDKVGWENSEFPIVCETCLGDNPYVRMMKAEFDKECKVCSRPFTVFRWRAGTNGRYKKTEICQTCAKLKNVCQTCLLDLEFGLPVQVRDAAAPNSTPQSDINREWYAEQADRQVASGQITPAAYGKVENRGVLQKLARANPYYKRNQAHVCSFFAKGECKRGAECPYRHEIVEENDLSHQNIKDRYQGVNDPVALKLLGRASVLKLTPPADRDIKTLFVSGVDQSITEQDLKDQFYSYGEIQDVKIVQVSSCAFITFTTREAAENAADKMANNLMIHDKRLKLSWGKPQAHDITGSESVKDSSYSYSAPNFFSLPTKTLTSTNATDSNSQSIPTTTVPYAAPPLPGVRTFYPAMNPQRFGSKTDR